MSNVGIGVDEVAWGILEAAVTNDNSEILTALLGVRTPSSSQIYTSFQLSSSLVQKERLIEHLQKLSGHRISEQHAERYLRNIIFTLCTKPKDEDVKHLALASLVYWILTPAYLEIAEMLYNVSSLFFT